MINRYLHFWFKSVILSLLGLVFVGLPTLLYAQDANDTLRIVTWNIEWYGSTSSGPSNVFRQRINAAEVLNRLAPDVIGLQEITSEEALEDLAERLDGEYAYYWPTHISQSQRMPYLVNTQSFDVLGSPFGWGSSEGLDSFDFAGRFPYVMLTDYKRENETHRMRFVNIHAKAFSDLDSYNRRVSAARDLHRHINTNHFSENLVFLGDYNDDVDVSIYNERSTPYRPFVLDEDDFNIVTAELSERRLSSTVSFGEMIDHITISNELEELVNKIDVMVFNPENIIANYGNTTSDHYPIVADLIFGTPTDLSEEVASLPSEFTLEAYPNPFNPSTTIRFSLSQNSTIDLSVWDMQGRRIQQLSQQERFVAGSHSVRFDATALRSGVYFVRLRTDQGQVQTIPLTLIK